MFKKSNLLRHMEKRVQFFESYLKNGSILWVIFLIWTMVQFYESWFEFYESMLKRRVQFLWVNVEKKGSISMSHVEKRVQYCESCWTEWKIQFFESCWTEGFNSLSHFEKGFNSVSQIKKMGSIQWVIFFTIRFNSWSHISKCSMLRVFVEKNWITFKKKFNSLCHIQRTISLSLIKEGVQFLESY